MRSAGRWSLRHRRPTWPQWPTYPKEQPKWRCRLTGFANLLFILSLLHGLVVLTVYDQNTTMRKVETPIFLVEKPSNETIATTFNIFGIQAQHDQVTMAMHGVTTETRYIHVLQKYMYLKTRTQITCISMVIHIILLQKCHLRREFHKK